MFNTFTTYNASLHTCEYGVRCTVYGIQNYYQLTFVYENKEKQKTTHKHSLKTFRLCIFGGFYGFSARKYYF